MCNLLSSELKFIVITDLSSESIVFFCLAQQGKSKTTWKKKRRKSKIFSMNFLIDREIIYVLMIKKSELRKEQNIESRFDICMFAFHRQNISGLIKPDNLILYSRCNRSSDVLRWRYNHAEIRGFATHAISARSFRVALWRGIQDEIRY